MAIPHFQWLAKARDEQHFLWAAAMHFEIQLHRIRRFSCIANETHVTENRHGGLCVAAAAVREWAAVGGDCDVGWLTMATLVPNLAAPSTYRDYHYRGSVEQYQSELGKTKTIYLGNLSFHTTEFQLHAIFSLVAAPRRIILGLDRVKHTPCGFAFVEFYTHEECMQACKYLNGVKIDDRIVRTDLDAGWSDGRQYGRGRHGGQVRDEWREEYDEGRGGWGARRREDMERVEQLEKMRDVEQLEQGGYVEAALVPTGADRDATYGAKLDSKAVAGVKRYLSTANATTQDASQEKRTKMQLDQDNSVEKQQQEEEEDLMGGTDEELDETDVQAALLAADELLDEHV